MPSSIIDQQAQQIIDLLYSLPQLTLKQALDSLPLGGPALLRVVGPSVDTLSHSLRDGREQLYGLARLHPGARYQVLPGTRAEVGAGHALANPKRDGSKKHPEGRIRRPNH